MNKDDFIHYKNLFVRQSAILLKNIPLEVQKILVRNNALICGGAVTSVFSRSVINDFDLYSLSKPCVSKLLSEFKAINGMKVVFTSDNAVTIEYKNQIYQIIQRVTPDSHSHSSVEEVLSAFDFTVCMAAYDISANEFILYKTFMSDLASRVLVYNINSGFPICSLYRTLKYQKRGFKLSGSEIVKMSLCICRLDMQSYSDLREQLMGIDTYVFSKLTSSLIENHSESDIVDFGAVMDVIDEHLRLHPDTDSEGFISEVRSDNSSVITDEDLPFM